MNSSPPTIFRRSLMLVRPRPKPRAASTSKPTPSSRTVSSTVSPVRAKTNLEVLAPAVPHRVVQGFLQNPEKTERHVRRDTGRYVLEVEIDLNPSGR